MVGCPVDVLISCCLQRTINDTSIIHYIRHHLKIPNPDTIGLLYIHLFYLLFFLPCRYLVPALHLYVGQPLLLFFLHNPILPCIFTSGNFYLFIFYIILYLYVVLSTDSFLRE